MKRGLILEGGAKRGIYTAGVLDVLLENGLMADGVIGVSAGAIHGCSYVAKQYERSIRYNMNYGNDYRFMSLRSWWKTGNVVDVDFCYHELPEKLDPFDNEAFKHSDTKFYVVCSNVETGEPEYIYCKDLIKDIDYLRASASLPFFSKIVEIDGKKTMPANVVVLTKEPNRVVMQMTIREGRNRQIRKMCEAVGLEVARLKRTAIGPLRLGMLKPGEYRELTAEELRAIRTAINKGQKENA